MGWQPLPLGAGGFVRGLDIHADGTMVCRLDTYGAHIFNPPWLPIGKWVPLIRASAFPVGNPIVDYAQLNSSSPPASIPSLGVFGIRIAPSNSSRFYMLLAGYLYTSIDKGQTWQATNYPADTTNVPNDQSNFGGFDYKIAIDPHNEQVVVVGTGAGVRYSTNAGGAWATITTVATPTNNPGACCVEFDPSSWTSGNTPGIYIESYGNGVYHSSTGPGGTFTLTTSGPTTARHMTCGPDGTLYCISNVNSDPLYRYNVGGVGGAWVTTTYTGNGSTFGLYGAAQLAIDPSTSGATTRVVIVDGAGGVNVSTDRGATFAVGTAPVTGNNTDIPWLGTVDGFLIAACAFDPSQSNKLYAANGVGMVWCNPSNTGGGTVAWNDQSAGIEQLVVTSITSVPGGNLLVSCWDRPEFTLTSPTGSTYPSVYNLAPTAAPHINEGYPSAYCPSTPSFVAQIAEFRNRGIDSSGSSSDGGITWTPFPTLPTDLVNFKTGGQLALVSPTNWVVFVGGDEEPHATSGVWRTTNAGSSWTDIAITGVTGGWNPSDDFGGTNRTVRRVVDVDSAGTIYAYNYGFSTGAAGIYTSSNGGTSFTLAHAGRFDFSTQSFFAAKLRCVPGQPGNAFYASGTASDQPGSGLANTPFYRTTDSGVTWPPVSGVTNVAGFGYGKSATLGGYPSIFIWGCVGGSSIANYGVWRSTDNAASWQRVGGLTQTGAAGGDIFPNNSMDQITCIEGDMNVFGVCYVGFSGSGAAVFVPDAATGGPTFGLASSEW